MDTIFNTMFRKKVNLKNRSRLNINGDISVFSSNCYGAIMLHDLNLKFNSPFVNLWMKPKDYIKFLKNPKYYLGKKMSFITEENINYPIGKIDDIKIYFMHYKSENEAEQKWDERKKRINFDNLFVLFTDRDGCTYDDLKEFDELPYKNKIVFTHAFYPEIKSCFYIKGFENKESVGHCYKFKNLFSGYRIFDQFDYVRWFNNDLNSK